jgi:hypothetical protein
MKPQSELRFKQVVVQKHKKKFSNCLIVGSDERASILGHPQSAED